MAETTLEIAPGADGPVEPPFVPRPEAVLTTRQVARWLQVSETQVRRLNLPCIEVGRGRWRYLAGQVLEELKRRAERGGPSLL